MNNVNAMRQMMNRIFSDEKHDSFRVFAQTTLDHVEATQQRQVDGYEYIDLKRKDVEEDINNGAEKTKHRISL